MIMNIISVIHTRLLFYWKTIDFKSLYRMARIDRTIITSKLNENLFCSFFFFFQMKYFWTHHLLHLCLHLLQTVISLSFSVIIRGRHCEENIFVVVYLIKFSFYVIFLFHLIFFLFYILNIISIVHLIYITYYTVGHKSRIAIQIFLFQK